MIYPRIFSLSTVGIRHHYNQDYLIHPERTDFVGRNGVGKSIVADLLQLLFVFDKSIIRFGTEGVDQREIHTLPYKTSTAYVFLNIEIKAGNFILLGTCISDKRGERLRPFIISKSANLDEDIFKNCITSNELLFCKQFLNGKSIPTIDNLAKLVRDNYNLTLTDFTYRTDIDNYYRFLFNKEILPIDLSKASNLTAYAKVLQSFSKAKGLDLKQSEHLQQFLFENAREEFFEGYSKHKNDLDKLLFDYNCLDQFIAVLEDKQKVLEKLKELEEVCQSDLLSYRMAETIAVYWQKEKAREKVEITQLTIKNTTKELELLTEAVDNAKSEELNAQNSFNAADEDLDNLLVYKNAYSEISQMQNWVQRLVEIKALIKGLAFSTADKKHSRVNKSNSDILEEIETALPLLRKYGSSQEIESKYNEQNFELNRLIASCDNEVQKNNDLLKLLSSKEDSVIHSVLKEYKQLSIEQESILLYLVDYPMKKPAKPQKSVRYLKGIAAFESNHFEVDKDSGGLWLKLGDLMEFVPFIEKRYFDTPEKFKSSIQVLIKKINEQNVLLSAKLRELDNVKRSQPYSSELLAEYQFDLLLIEYSFIEKIKRGVSSLANLDFLISKFKVELQPREEAIVLNKKILAQVKKTNIDTVIQLFRSEKKRLKEELDFIKLQNSTNSKNYIEKKAILPTLKGNIITESETLLNLESNYNTMSDNFKRDFPGVILQFDLFVENAKVEETEKKWQGSVIAYRSYYQSIPERFAETKDRKDSRLNLQIDNGIFGFEEMELVILGNKIKHRDKIGEHLQEANQNRLALIEGIRSDMIKVFGNTIKKYKAYERVVKDVNTFFRGKKISELFYFKIHFVENKEIPIAWIDRLQTDILVSYKSGELQFGRNIEDFIQEIFQNLTSSKLSLSLAEMLDPLTYFTLGVSLTDDNGEQIPGSTGEAYSAISLLGIARLSKVQNSDRVGLRFIILEETANLDKVNFNTFPKIAQEYKYQIFTMTPEPYGGSEESEWYMHHLIKGQKDVNINPTPSSYFKSRTSHTDLKTYLDTINREI